MMSHPAVTGSPHVLTAQWILPVSRAPIENGYIAFADGKIIGLGKISELSGQLSARAFSLPPQPGSLITPGLINCHVHLEQSFPQVIPKEADEPFTHWLLNVVSRLKAQSSAEEKAQRCRQGVEELLQTGTTCINDIASGPESLQALAEKGLRGIVSLEVFHPAVEPVKIDHWVLAYKQLQQVADPHPLLIAGLSPHSPYNVSPAAWHALLNACQPPIVHTHIAEFSDEDRYLTGQPSSILSLHQAILNQQFAPQTPTHSAVDYLHQFNLLNAKTIAAHAIETNAEDRQCLTESGVGIAHCPRSNLALHGKTLSMEDWKDFPIPMGLGTDGRLSTEDLDLRAEARCAMHEHGWNARQALEALTLQGARALKMEQAIGTLDMGKEADLVVWQAEILDTSTPEQFVLQASTAIQQTWIAGKCQWQRRIG